MPIKVKDFDDILKKDYNKNACKEVFVGQYPIVSEALEWV